MDIDDAHIVAYKDEIALLVTGNTRNDIIEKTESAPRGITDWADERALSFSKEKSVMVPLKGGLVPGFTAVFGTHRIRSVTSTRYLGLQVGKDFTFDENAIYLIDSSSDMFSRIKYTRKSKWGTSPELAMMLFKAVYLPRVLYGSGMWYSKLINRRRLMAKLQSALLAVTGAYRTSSTMAIQVISGAPPIDLQLEMYIDVVNGTPKEEAKNICISKWQTRWNESTTGRWTYSFLPDLRMATPLTFGHYICQILTRHGDINYKLNSFNLVESPDCRCEDQAETTKHILEDCQLANAHRL